MEEYIMNKLPEVNESCGELYRIIFEPMKSKLLLTAIELKVFNQLSEPRSAEAVADALGTHPENTKLFLNGLAACDLVIKKKGLYQNRPDVQTFLVEGSPIYAGQGFAHFAKFHFALNNLSNLVKEGPPSTLPDMGSEDMWADSLKIGANTTRAGSAQQMVEIISRLPEFPSFRKMLDLGGGTGLNCIGIVSAHPTMKGVIFDRPAILNVAKTFIKEYETEDRVEVLEGDYLQDSIGERYDLILASATLSFARHDLDSVVKRIYNALNPGGVFINFSEGLTEERTKPESMVLMIMSMTMMGRDLALDQGEIANSMLRAGFKSVRSRTLDTCWGPMDLDIGRKA
jgi:hypothetical protein